MLTSRKFVAMAGIAVIGLSACETSLCDLTGSGGQAAAADEMLNCVGSLQPTSVAQMPTSGTATYNGFVSGQYAPTSVTTDNIIGDAVLTANFGAGSLTGTMNNFNSTAQGNMAGTLGLTSGVIAGNLVSVNVNGTLTGSANAVTFATSGVGGFLGDSAAGFLAGTSGTAVTGGFTDTSAGLTVFVHQ